ncbi:hypothetical protein JCM10207_000173 [Rhodosporidiobolus poonsookiae]
MSDNTAAKKATRSRAACDGCRTTKQRCDGPSVVPCRRCQLYGLACTYTGPDKKVKSAKVAAAAAPAHASASTSQPGSVQQQQSPPLLPLQPASAGLSGEKSESLLYDISARLRSIESALSHLQLSSIASSHPPSSASHVPFDAHPNAGDPASPHGTGSGSGNASSPISPGGAAADEPSSAGAGGLNPRPAGANALAAITEAVDMLSALAGASGAGGGGSPGQVDLFGAGGEDERGGAGGGESGSATPRGDGGVAEIEALLRDVAGRWARPDAVSRGVMSEQEVEGSFRIFFTHLVAHVPVFPDVPLNAAFPPGFSPSETRARSPLLYHAILYVTAYFLWPKTARGKEVYLGLERIVSELLGSLVLGGRKEDWRIETIVGLVLLTLWKAVPFSHFLHEHDIPPARAELAAKTNAASSASLYAHISLVSARLDLTTAAPTAFAQAFQAAWAAQASSSSSSSSPSASNSPQISTLASRIPASTLLALRTLLQVIIIDAHGALSHGRAPLLSSPRALAPTLRCTRAFATLAAQPADVRLAASAELYALVLEQLGAEWYAGASAGGAWKEEWDKGVEEWWSKMKGWDDDWNERLEKAYRDGDRFASFASKYCTVTRIGVLASVFIRWSRHRRFQAIPSPAASPLSPPPSTGLSSAPSSAPTTRLSPALSPFEWDLVQRLLDSVEHMIFSLSVESRAEGYATSGAREVRWPALDERGERPALQVDPDVVAMYRTGIDPYTCVGFAYPLILVSKICNQGLARCELRTTSPFAPETSRARVPPDLPFSHPLSHDNPSATGTRPRAIMRGRKLHRVLELGAGFLDAIAPTKGHPAAVHAATLRVIMRAGLWGQDAHDRAAEGQPAPPLVQDQAGSSPLVTAGEAGKILRAVLQGLSPLPPPSAAMQPNRPAQQQPPSSAPFADTSFATSASTSASQPFLPLGDFPSSLTSLSPGTSSSDPNSFFSLSSLPIPTLTGFDFSADTAFSSTSTSTSALPSPPFAPDFSALFATPAPSFSQSAAFASPSSTLAGDVGLGSSAPSTSAAMDLDAGTLDWAALEASLGIASGGLRGALLESAGLDGGAEGVFGGGEEAAAAGWGADGTWGGFLA